jgi:GMP synthase-like glutamine amidotransferase
MRVAIVDNLLRSEEDLSEVAYRHPGFDAKAWLKRERHIASLALANIESNVRNLVARPEVKTFHLSEVTAEAIDEFAPDAIVVSGTLTDFDFYSPTILGRFADFVQTTSVPVLGICGGHQLIGQSFGVEIITLDRKLPSERRENRLNEYQYRFVKIVKDDPIFDRIDDRAADSSPTVRGRQRVLRVWQNHGLQVDRLPEGFELLAVGYLCPVQMMVRRTDRQLIYTVQFHIEKSFEDWGKPRKFWDHAIESRDGRIIFDNFLAEALRHRATPRAILPAAHAGAAPELADLGA